MSSIFIFASLNFEESKLVQPYFRKRTYKNGETVFNDGDHGDFMGIVESGKVAVCKGELQIAAIVPGSPFGELSMLDGKPRSATCKADGDCVVYTIDDQDLMRLTVDHPMIGAKIYRAIAFSLSSRMRRANAQLAAMVWGDV